MDHAADAEGEPGFASERRQSWARLPRKVLEVDPLLCPHCQVEMKMVSVIAGTAVVDAILRHVDQRGRTRAARTTRPVPGAGSGGQRTPI